MLKKLSKYGNSRAIIIDKPILKLLDISDDTELKIKIEGESIVITPKKKTKGKKKKTGIVSKDKRFQRIYEETVEKYSDVLKKLARE